VTRRSACLALALLAGLALPAGASAALVYQPDRGTGTRIVVARDDGTGRRTLPVRGLSPVVSPDGGLVAFATPSAAAAGKVRIVRLATGAVTRTDQVCLARLAWSPDSTRILCQTESANARGFITGNGLALIDAATGASRALVRARGSGVEGYSWSPDGTRIAYANGGFTSRLRSVVVADPADMAASRRRLIRNATAPVWGPVKIAVARYRYGTVVRRGVRNSVVRSQIWTVNPGGGGAHQLTRYSASALTTTGPFPSFWTPSGDRIVGTISGTDQSDLITVGARTGTIRRLGPGDAAPDGISADGRTILYTTGFLDTNYRLRTIGIGGRRGRLLVRNASSASVSADWAP